MLPWNLREVAALVDGRPAKGDGGLRVTGVCHDTRAVKKGDLFVAIRGARLDGHGFLRQAARKGARAAVVSRDVPAGLPQIRVADTTYALGQLGMAQRLQWNGKVVAVTGSVGKTTVKDMTAHLLSGGRRVLKTKGNLNNQWGLPLTLLQLTQRHGAAVVEVGINHPGEMQRLSEIARPDIAIVTAIGEAHLGFFKDRRQLAEEKKKIAAHLRAGGIRIVNADDALLKTAEKDAVTFGLRRGRVRARDLRPDGWGTRFVLEAGGERASTRLSLPGVHNVRNSLAAVAAGLALGVPLKALARRLESFVSQAPMRMEIKDVKGIRVVNDAYNASPTSMEAALETFRSLEVPRRKIAVLGDMLEMGDFSRDAHRRIVRRAAEGPWDLLVLVGNRMKQAAGELPGALREKTRCFADAAETAPFLRETAQRGDAVLLKASRGMGLEKVLESFL